MQRAVYWDDRRFLVIVAGRGTGKTTSACMRILGMIERGEMPPGSRILVIAPDYQQLRDGTLKSFDTWFGPSGADIVTHSINRPAPLRILRGDIEVMFRSGINPDQTRSKECTLVWLDEAAQMDEEMFRLTNANLRQWGDKVKYQTIITTTPRGKNWIYRRFGHYLLNPASHDDPLVGAYRTTTLDAFREGVVRTGYVEEMGYAPGTEMWRQELEAEFVDWSGLVFQQHWEVLDGDLPPFVHVTAGVDMGTVSPTAIELAGITQSGKVCIFGEFYQPRARLQDVMQAIGERAAEHNVHSWHVDNDLLWKMMRSAGVRARPPNKHADAASFSISYINSLISRGMFAIHASCHGLISEMSEYSYREHQSGDERTSLERISPYQRDHAIDAVRYAIKPLSAWKAARQYGREVRFHIAAS